MHRSTRKIMSTMRRIMLLKSAGLMAMGIALTGWDRVHWLLYVTPVLFTLFGATGVCPGRLLDKARAGT